MIIQPKQIIDSLNVLQTEDTCSTGTCDLCITTKLLRDDEDFVQLLLGAHTMILMEPAKFPAILVKFIMIGVAIGEFTALEKLVGGECGNR